MSHYEISPREREDEARRDERDFGTAEAEAEQDAFDDRHLMSEQGQPEGWISE